MRSRGKPLKQAAVNVFRFVVNSLACVDPKPCGPRKRVVRSVKLQVSIGRKKKAEVVRCRRIRRKGRLLLQRNKDVEGSYACRIDERGRIETDGFFWVRKEAQGAKTNDKDQGIRTVNCDEHNNIETLAISQSIFSPVLNDSH
jgi:hypothetical protein